MVICPSRSIRIGPHIELTVAQIHLAAFYGRPGITAELISKGAKADDVEKPGMETPLAMAAFEGNITVMELLLTAKADVNAESAADTAQGLVLNSAIYSGNKKAVELLVNKGAIIHSDKYSPLAYAVALPDREIYDYLLKAGQVHLQPYDYGMALKAAAEYGNTEVFTELLEHEHEKQYIQDALSSAAEEEEWDIVRLILDKHNDLECDKLIVSVAKATEPQAEILDFVWDKAKGSISREALNKALFEAADNEKELIVQKLLDFGADANATDPDSEYVYPTNYAHVTDRTY